MSDSAAGCIAAAAASAPGGKSGCRPRAIIARRAISRRSVASLVIVLRSAYRRRSPGSKIDAYGGSPRRPRRARLVPFLRQAQPAWLRGAREECEVRALQG